MDVKVIQQAVNEIVSELHGTERQFEQLRKRKEDLEAAMASMTVLLRGGAPLLLQTPFAESQAPEYVEHTSSTQVDEEGRPVWMLVRELLAQELGPLSVPEIQKVLNRDRIVVANPDAIRIAMRRKPGLFLNVNGRYSLQTHSTDEAGNAVEDAVQQFEERQPQSKFELEGAEV